MSTRFATLATLALALALFVCSADAIMTRTKAAAQAFQHIQLGAQNTAFFQAANMFEPLVPQFAQPLAPQPQFTQFTQPQVPQPQFTQSQQFMPSSQAAPSVHSPPPPPLNPIKRSNSVQPGSNAQTPQISLDPHAFPQASPPRQAWNTMPNWHVPTSQNPLSALTPQAPPALSPFAHSPSQQMQMQFQRMHSLSGQNAIPQALTPNFAKTPPGGWGFAASPNAASPFAASPFAARQFAANPFWTPSTASTPNFQFM